MKKKSRFCRSAARNQPVWPADRNAWPGMTSFPKCAWLFWFASAHHFVWCFWHLKGQQEKTESYWVNPEVSQAIECYDLWPTSNSNSGGIHYLNIPSSSFFTNKLSTSTIVKDLCKLNWYAICVLRPRHHDSKFYPLKVVVWCWFNRLNWTNDLKRFAFFTTSI